MRYADLNIVLGPKSPVNRLVDMGTQLGYSVLGILGNYPISSDSSDTVTLCPRAEATSKRLSSLRKEVGRIRHKFLVVAFPLGGIETTNWAAEEGLVDLLTVNPRTNPKLRKTTARLAAGSGTALEIPILPLLRTTGLVRSKIIKTFSETIRTAKQSGMKVILSSGAFHPLQIRSPRALQHIGMLLGLERSEAKAAVSDIPIGIIEHNIRRMSDNYILPGVEIVGDP